jgi:hypothetical protein
MLVRPRTQIPALCVEEVDALQRIRLAQIHGEWGGEEPCRLTVLSEEPEKIAGIASEQEPRAPSTTVETEDAIRHSIQLDRR